MNDCVLLSTAYLPPIEYIALLATKKVQIEGAEYFQKQSYRNRTIILTANGVHPLIVPILHSQHKIDIYSVKIDNRNPWQRIHWKTIQSAYNNSPFFLYYQDFFSPFFTNQFQYLFDFNLQLLNVITKLLNISYSPTITSQYLHSLSDAFDGRNLIHPKNRNVSSYPFTLKQPYNQVFTEKFGFISNLSILDLIFNEGNNSKQYIHNFCNFADCNF